MAEAGPSRLANPGSPSNHSGLSGGTSGTGVSAADVTRAQDNAEHALVGVETHSRIVDELHERIDRVEQEMRDRPDHHEHHIRTNRGEIAAMRTSVQSLQQQLASRDEEIAQLRKMSTEHHDK